MNLGFIGTGKIASSVITGICKSKISYKKIIISPRNKKIAKGLERKYRKIVIAKHNQQIINESNWIFLAITIFLNFLFNPCAIFLFLGEIIIFLKESLDLHIPVITEAAIFPVPIKPKIIISVTLY